MYAKRSCLLVCVLIPCLHTADNEKAARAIGTEFMKLFDAKDLDGVMKLVGVPWCHDKQGILKETEQVKSAIAEIFKEKDFTKVEWKFVKAERYGKFRENQKGDKRWNAVIGEDDYLVIFQVRKEQLFLFVRIRDGHLKVVGFED